MKQLVLMLAAIGVGVFVEPSFAQTATPEPSSTVSSYSAPTVEHVKKPKTAKTTNTAKKHWWKKKAAPAAAASE
jgi:hypothetical protein